MVILPAGSIEWTGVIAVEKHQFAASRRCYDLSDPAHVKPTLRNIKRFVGIVTYGRLRYMALWMSDPPRKIVKRYLRWFTGGKARADYYALYHLNVATDAQRAAFMAKVARAMRSL